MLHSVSAPLPSSLQLAGLDLPLSFAVIAGIAVLYALYLTLSPLLEESEISSEEWSRMEDESLALLAKRDRVIAELKDLEFEAAMNKIDAADLSKLKSQYEREALRLIEALDQQAASYNSDIQETVTATREAARARKAKATKAEETLETTVTETNDSTIDGNDKDEVVDIDQDDSEEKSETTTVQAEQSNRVEVETVETKVTMPNQDVDDQTQVKPEALQGAQQDV